MSEKNIKGIDTSQEDQLSNLKKDLTPTPVKIKRYLTGKGVWVLLIGIILAFSLIPSLQIGMELALIIVLLIFSKNINHIEKLPFKKPQSKGKGDIDLNQLNPANDKPEAPKGITFFGNEQRTKKEVWFANDDVRTHCLIFGTTGAGKALKDDEMVHTPKEGIQ